MTYWTEKYTEGHYIGFETLMERVVPVKMQAEALKDAVTDLGKKIAGKVA